MPQGSSVYLVTKKGSLGIGKHYSIEHWSKPSHLHGPDKVSFIILYFDLNLDVLYYTHSLNVEVAYLILQKSVKVLSSWMLY